ncbi:unnamed protein product [Prorocentrum cordatum]|uniref:Uncharacterized protein n=1 Tax=Prorocentrum cordatum TaxID=2364126 RepID=A0ABN9Y1U9_9DINO|nr:unnamed protein product [Polarella glacialis]
MRISRAEGPLLAVEGRLRAAPCEPRTAALSERLCALAAASRQPCLGRRPRPFQPASPSQSLAFPASVGCPSGCSSPAGCISPLGDSFSLKLSLACQAVAVPQCVAALRLQLLRRL